MPTVNLELESRPESVVVVRGVLAGVADLLEFDRELLHNLKTVVSEACNNVALHAYDDHTGRLVVSLEIGDEGVEAVVRDWGRGIREVAPSEDRLHVGLAVISAVADRAQFLRAPDGGTEVRMTFAGQHVPGPNGSMSDDGREQPAIPLSGEAIARLSPVGLLATVLTRVATTLAARARFSLDRFCDVYLITDAVAAHAVPAAVGDRVGFAVATGEHRLELTVGPFRAGSGLELRGREGLGQLGTALALLAVELVVEPVDGVEMWRLVVMDSNGAGVR
ncbi:MAG TPA: ATP-binding protein [Solirubrobacteraceae bacterium]|nr:ATP-binding protein [Solirubrobacteraceae bacterium]